MKAAIPLLAAALLAGCASAPRSRVDAGELAQRLGLPANVAYSLHGCRYAQALPQDESAEFVGGATCVVFPDRLAIVRARARADRAAFFRYKALDGIALASSGWRSQLQMRAAGTLLVVEMDTAAGDPGASQRAFALARGEGVPVFQADFLQARGRGAPFVPPAF